MSDDTSAKRENSFPKLLEKALKATRQIPESRRVSPRLSLKPAPPEIDYEQELLQKLEEYEQSIEIQRPRHPDEITAVNALRLTCHAVRATWNSARLDPFLFAYQFEEMSTAARAVERLATQQYRDTGRAQAKHSPDEREKLDNAFRDAKRLINENPALTRTEASKQAASRYNIGRKKVSDELKRCGIEGSGQKGRKAKKNK